MSDETMYPPGITPEKLMAYADGTLEPDEARQVDAAIASNPELAEEVESYRLTRDVLGGAFDAPLHEPVPADLEALVMGDVEETETVTSLHAERMRRTRSFPVWGQALAACGVFAIGAVMGSAMLGPVSPSENGELLVAGRLDLDHPAARVLEARASAEIVDVPGGRFDVVATFPTSSGTPCREFEATNERGAVVGIACRRDAAWTIELLLRAEPTVSPQGGFQLASSFDMEVMDTVLTGLGAEQGLGKDQEACLIENDWNPENCTSTGE